MLRQPTILLLFLLMTLINSFQSRQNTSLADSPFVRVENGEFMKGDTPYDYVVTNFWYGAILGSECVGGNRERLIL